MPIWKINKCKILGQGSKTLLDKIKASDSQFLFPKIRKESWKCSDYLIGPRYEPMPYHVTLRCSSPKLSDDVMTLFYLS